MNQDSANASVQQSMKSLNFEIYSLLQSYKDVYVHRSKIACLCQSLNAFQKELNTRKFSDTPPPPQEYSAITEVNQQIKRVKIMFSEASQSQFIDTLTRKPVIAIRSEILDFANQFNNILTFLPYLPQNPINLNPTQVIRDELNDVVDLKPRIEEYKSRVSCHPAVLQLLNDRVQEAEQIKRECEQESRKNGINNNQALGPQEIANNLSSLREFEVQHNDFELQKKIGTGGFADVFLGYQKSTQKVVAVKVLHNNEMNAQLFSTFKRETEIQAKLKHFAILPFIGVCFTPPYKIITEFMSGGCLFKRLRSKPALDPTKKTIIALGTAMGLEYMHKLSFIHRDIKSLNILLDADDFPKVCDFGMSRIQDNVMTGAVGTVQWEAPEVINSDPYTAKCDVYSYGILLWELLTCDVPFRGLNQMQVAMSVLSNQTRPMVPNDCPPKLSKFIKKCWDTDPNYRPDFSTIVRVISSGEIVFPGTNMTMVQSYISRFGEEEYSTLIDNTKSLTGIIQSMPSRDGMPARPPMRADTPSKRCLEAALQDLEGPDRLKILEFLAEISEAQSWKQIIEACHVSDVIINLCKSIDNPQGLGFIFKIVSKLQSIGLFPDQEAPMVLDLFSKFGTTDMPDIVDYLVTIIQKGAFQIKFVQNQIVKLAPFMQSSNLGSRKSVTFLFFLIVKFGLFENMKLITIILSPLLGNINAKSFPALLKVSIELLELIISIKELIPSLISHDAIPVLINLLFNGDDELRLIACKLSILIVSQNVASDDDVKVAINAIDQANKALPSEFVARFLAIVAYIIPPSYSGEHEVFPKLASYLRLFMSSSDPKVCLVALKMSYMYMSYKPISKEFFKNLDFYHALIMCSIEPVSIAAASCLLLMYPYLNERELNTVLDNNFFTFLMRSLSSESILTETGLRTIGLLSSHNPDFAMYLEKNGIIDHAIKMLSTSSQEIKYFAFQALASFSSANPMSQYSVSIVETVLASLTDQSIAPYPMIILSNIVVHPIVAIECAKKISVFSSQWENSEIEQAGRILLALQSIFSIIEAQPYIEDIESMISTIQASEKYVQTTLWTDFIELIDHIAANDFGKQAIKQTEIINLLLSTLQDLPQYHRTLVIRILTRASQ